MMSEFVRRNLRYPADALRSNAQGTVVVQFVLDRTGEMVSSEVIERVSAALDKEALRVVNAMPAFTPAQEEGVTKEFTYTLPVRFAMVSNTNIQTSPNNNGLGSPNNGPNRRF